MNNLPPAKVESAATVPSVGPRPQFSIVYNNLNGRPSWDLFWPNTPYAPCFHWTLQEALDCITEHNHLRSFALEIVGPVPENADAVEDGNTRDATTPCWLLAMRDADEAAEAYFDSLLPAGDEKAGSAPVAGGGQ